MQDLDIDEIRSDMSSNRPLMYEHRLIPAQTAYFIDFELSKRAQVSIQLWHCMAIDDIWLRGPRATLRIQPDEPFTYIRGASESNRAPLSFEDVVAIREALFSGDDVMIVNVTSANGLFITRSSYPEFARVRGALCIDSSFFDYRGMPTSILFDRVEMNKHIILKNIECSGSIDFLYCRIRELVSIRNSTVGGIDVVSTDFAANVSMVANAVSWIGLHNSSFDCPVEIKAQSRLSDYTRVEWCRFFGAFDFSGNFLNNLFFTGTILHRGVNLSGSVFKGEIDITDADISGYMELPSTYWYLPWWRKSWRWITRRKSVARLGVNLARRQRELGEGNEDLSSKVNWFLRLLSNWPKERVLVADNANVDGCTNLPFRRWIQDENYLRQWRVQSRLHRVLYLPWSIFTDCGRSLFLWAFWSSVVIVIFAVIHTHGWEQIQFSQAFRQSLETFASLEIGAERTSGTSTARLVERVIGYGMLGLLIAILAEKVVRRS